MSVRDDFETVLENAERAIQDLEELDIGLGDETESALESLTDDQRETVLDSLDDLWEVVDQSEDILEAIDVSELPDAIDLSDVLEAIQTGEIPEALSEGDADDVVNVRQLVRAINLTELWRATDLAEVWESKRAIEDSVESIGDGEDEDGVLEEAASTVTGEDGDDDSGDQGMLEEAGDAVDDATDAVDDVGDEMADEFTDQVGSFDLGGDDGSFGLDAAQTEAYQTMIQQQAIAGIDEFREALLVTHETFQRLYEENREKMRRSDRGTNSRNPTAASTMPLERADVPSTIRHSTVPREVRLSTAPSRRRIYGPRFERELERLRSEGADTGGTTGGGD